MSRRTYNNHAYTAINDSDDDGLMQNATSSFHESMIHKTNRTVEQDYLSFPKWSLWAGLAFTIAVVIQQVSLPIFRSNEMKSAAHILPFFGLFVTWILLAFGFVFLLLRRQITTITGKSMLLTFASGVLGGLGIVLLSYACDGSPEAGRADSRPERLGVRQQIALSNAWVVLAWPLAHYLYPKAVGSNSIDTVILVIVQIAGIVGLVLGLLPSFIDSAKHVDGGGAHMLFTAMWVIGIFSLWISRIMLWGTTAKPRNWRDIITQTFYSTTLALVTVLALIWVDLVPTIGYAKTPMDIITNNWGALARLSDLHTHLAAFILFIFATIVTTVIPPKAYLVSIAPTAALVVLIAGFNTTFPGHSNLTFIFPSVSLGFMATCFWGFIESRIRWQANVIRGRFKLKKDSPLPRANIVSRLFFCWNVELLKYGFQSKIQIEDVPDVVSEETVESAYSKFRSSIRQRGLRDSMLPTFAHTIGYQYFYSLIAFTIFLICHIFTPGYLLPQILKRISPAISFLPDHTQAPIIITPESMTQSYYYVLGLSACSIIGALGYQHGWHWSMRCGIRARVAFIMAVYDKILTVRKLQSVGEVVNFLSSDSSRIIESIRFGWWLLLAPLSLFAIMGILIHYIGAISLVGMLILFLQMPIQLFVGSKIGAVRERAVALTDERVKIMNDILSSIKTVKLYCWEDSFADQVAQIRANEGRELSTTATVKYLNVAISFFSPTLATMLSLALYYGATHTKSGSHPEVDSYLVFTVASLFNASSAPLACLPMAIANIAQGFIGMARLQALMRQDDLKDTRILNMSREPLVRVKNATFAFDYDPEHERVFGTLDNDEHDSVSLRPSLEETGGFQLNRVNLSIENTGKLIAIVGKVGSGKSCFLAAIAGMLPALEGTVEVNGDISFLTQGGLLVNSTVKENILFGLPFNEEHYARTCEACELMADFKNLPNGDQTEVGEKGATLSGGQKARVGLARAVYADRPIYLLDDPLSAVDSRVGARIFEKCFKGALKNKIVVLVTNQPQYLPGCDEIIVLSNGRQVATGTYDQIKQDPDFASLLNLQQPSGSAAPSASSATSASGAMEIPVVDDPVQFSDDEDKPDLPLSSSLDELNRATESQRSMKLHSNQGSMRGVHESFEREDTDSDSEDLPAALAKDVAGSFKNVSVQTMVPVPAVNPADDVRERATMIEDEDASSEGVGLGTFVYYCFAYGTVAPLLVALFFVVVQLNRVAVDGYLSVLCYSAPVLSPMHWPMRDLLLLYASLVIVYLFMLMGRAAAFAYIATASSTSIHNVVFAKVLKAPLSFFESNPLGRILNRFSRDLDIVDGRLPDFFIDAFVFVIHCISIIIVICAIIPWFTFLLALMCVAFWMLITYYQRTARELKRLDAVSSSPIFAHLSVSIAGIATIRAYNAQERFRQENKDKINNNTRVYFAFEAVTNWVGLCLDLLAGAISTFVGMLTVWLSKDIPNLAGLVLTYSLMMTAAFQYAVRTATETENLLVAVQRLKEYADNLTTEGLRDHYPRPPVDWPTNGRIQFKDVVVKYRPELPPVLKRVNFTINPQEKVGIVGRTGAGKSTLIQVLFRLIEPAGGDILIDGVSTINLDLPDLRRKLACIPQDPVLFVGTIRSNLDPFNELEDQQLWDALDRVHMKKMVEAMPESIYSSIVEGGINFSLGQRQLICIARAILRGAKILVMDEATAAIDMESDQLIQNTVRSSFADVTVLTIAHRLATIVDYDRIMVVADGGIAEFESPKTLLANPDSIFYSMYHSH